MISFQGPINAMAGERLGHVLAAALLNFVVGLAVIIPLSLLLVRDKIDFSALSTMSPVLFTGGLLGASFVVLSIWLTPRLGVAAVIALGIAGQIVASLVLDHFGMLNLAVREVSVGRLTGAVLVVGGALMVRYL